MTEEWRDIKGFEGAYQVSNLGNVRSLDRDYIVADGVHRHYKGKLLTRVNAGKGYYIVMMQYKGRKSQQRVCRLVADAFCPNPYGYTQVNHKDENKSNDCADNLEWCTASYNVNYGTANKGRSIKHSRKINQYDLNGNYIRSWGSLTQAAKELKLYTTNISKACKGKYRICGNFKWKYAED